MPSLANPHPTVFTLGRMSKLTLLSLNQTVLLNRHGNTNRHPTGWLI